MQTVMPAKENTPAVTAREAASQGAARSTRVEEIRRAVRTMSVADQFLFSELKEVFQPLSQCMPAQGTRENLAPEPQRRTSICGRACIVVAWAPSFAGPIPSSDLLRVSCLTKAHDDPCRAERRPCLTSAGSVHADRAQAAIPRPP